jgi:protein N-lysine methyltransferase METTL21A
VYLEAAFPLLVSTLVALVPSPPERAPEVLLSYKKRRKADKRFFAMLKTHFTWSFLVCKSSE